MKALVSSKSLVQPTIYFLIFISAFACRYNDLREEKFQSTGVITGRDLRLCPSPCCGGWDITIDKSFYTFSSLPANSGIDLEKETFPLKVKLNWRSDSVCLNHIQILMIAKDQ